MKFVIMKSGFDTIWLSKFDETKVKLPEKAKAFDDYDDALEEALIICDSIENQDDLFNVTEDEIEEHGEKMLRWIA